MTQTQIASNVAYRTPRTNANVGEHTRRRWLDPHEFDSANKQKRAWLKAAVEVGKLKGNDPAILEETVFLTDPVNGKGCPSISTIKESLLKRKGLDLHYETVRRRIASFHKKKIIQVEARFSNEKGKFRQSNTIQLVGYEYKSEQQYDSELDNLNSYSYPLKENINNIHDEYVSLLANSDKKPEKKAYTKPKPKPKTHICNAKLKSEPKEEVKRVLIEHSLDESHTEYVCKALNKQRDIRNPGGYVMGIIKKLKATTVNAQVYDERTPQERIDKQELDEQLKDQASNEAHELLADELAWVRTLNDFDALNDFYVKQGALERTILSQLRDGTYRKVTN